MQAAGKSAPGLAQDEAAQEEPLQAVVLCDVFNQRFAPLTLDVPRCLMPVCNVPLIEWTLETLAIAGVQEVFLLATWHVQRIREYLETHHASLLRPAAGRGGGGGGPAQMKVSLIAVPEARSVGDTMRELDAHQVIKGDFVLLHGDAAGNLDVASVVRAHKQRRRVDRNAIMTVCTMPCEHVGRARRHGDLSVFTMAPQTAQLLHYASVPAVPRKRLLKLPLEMFEEAMKSTGGKGAEVDVRNDLVDCGVDICSIDVPPLFTENFDYQMLRRDFVQGILTSDLLEAKIFVHVAPPASASSTSSGEPWSASAGGVVGSPAFGAGYMLRASDPAGYDALNRDVLAGWTYPYSPAHTLPGGTQYSSHRVLRYMGAGSTHAKTARIGQRSVLGPESRLEEGAEVASSVLGARAHVGAGSRVQGSYLWEDVVVGARCSLEGCILGRGVRILDGVTLAPGTMVGDGCVLGPDVELGPGSRVSLHAYRASEEEEDEDWADGDTSASASAASRPAPGAEAHGFLWPALGEVPRTGDTDEEDEEEDELEHAENAQFFRMQADMSAVDLSDRTSSLSSVEADSEPLSGEERDSSSETEADDDSPLSGSMGGSMSLTLPAGAESQTYGEKLESEHRRSEFYAEARASLERAFEENHAPENAAIELKTLRMASNVPPEEVRVVVIAYTLSRCSADAAKQTADLLDHWGPLIRDVAQDDQVQALAVMQSYCAQHLSHVRLFVPLLKKLYNDEIVSDDAIVAWWKHPSSRRVEIAPDSDADAEEKTSEQVVLELRKRAEPVVRYIVEDSDEEESGDEEEEEDEQQQ